MMTEQIERGIYIDFEATLNERPSILGVLYKKDGEEKDTFVQYVLEENLYDAKSGCITATMNEAIREVLSIARSENRLIYAWSTKEERDIAEYCDPHISKEAQCFLRNAIPIAKMWHRRRYPGVIVPITPFRRRHTQEHYMKLIGFQVPSIYGPGKASQSIKGMRKAIKLKRGKYNSVDATIKSKWKGMLKHNEYDCKGMKAILEKIQQDTYGLKAA